VSEPSKPLRSAADLVATGLIAPQAQAAIEAVAARYAISITPAMAELIDPSDPNDPIARQFVPDPAELVGAPQERADPIGDDVHSPVAGIVHRYPDRVLLKLLHVCPVYCRFCFRREIVGPGGPAALSPEALATALAYIRARPAIWEVILTGGDPLALSARRLGEVMAALAAIDHVKVVRLHTRVPVVAPARIDDDLVATLRIAGKATYVALHANHPREFTRAAREACARLIDAGIPMVSQTVLLAGINDDAEVLGNLMRRFVENRIKPYYLHHGDLAPGTAHLRTDIATGQALMRALLGRLSGLCQPAYVLDIPGGFGKAPIGPSYVAESADKVMIEDYRGGLHAYGKGMGKSDKIEAGLKAADRGESASDEEVALVTAKFVPKA
jgi:lysine 2,3-aminomutase